MKCESFDRPREFRVGREGRIVLKDCGRLSLDENEQITVLAPEGKEWDITRKTWGFYATPSLNRRLPRFGLRAALVRSSDGAYFVWLVEREREEAMTAYMREEGVALACWLDDAAQLTRISQAPEKGGGPARCPTGIEDWEEIFTYSEPPPGETRFHQPAHQRYFRKILRSRVSGHFVSRHEMDLSALYQDNYVDSTYGDEAGLLRNFERIAGLPPEQSDNAARVDRILKFVGNRTGDVLDVGSGLCVFLARMKNSGWRCTAMDPDRRAARHAENHVGVRSICADFRSWNSTDTFDLITFNKVLEHVVDPIEFLACAYRHLRPRGIIYVEVPDGEGAVIEGPGREEFFIEHWHVYSAASLALTVRRAGFNLIEMERLREPSGKFTLRAFLGGIS